MALAIGAAAAPARRALREAVAAGEIDLIVGTHALFSADLVYANLGLVIIDEQHRFGVSQRRAIMERGSNSGSAVDECDTDSALVGVNRFR